MNSALAKESSTSLIQQANRCGGICLFGAAPDTANLGVSALCYSTIYALSSTAPEQPITVFDHGRGVSASERSLDGRDVRFTRCGGFFTNRLYRPESLWNIRVSARLGGLYNAGAQYIRSASAILDISGGDSFTDLYGPRRFQTVALPKLIALEQNKPLILLPQTYGPFRTASARSTAENIVRRVDMAWARDEHSYTVLRELLGDAFDPVRHKVGVDVAFRLPVNKPSARYIASMNDWFETRSSPVVGLNVSGLLLNRPAGAAEQFGLKADYQESILSFARRLLKESEARILLVPHVVAPPGNYESDIEACDIIAGALADENEDRVAVLPPLYDPCEVKWVISQCDWFCGTRMHSTIAALSSGVPTSAISYSPKTLGVFEICGLGAHVADPCRLDTGDLVECLWQSWLKLEQTLQTLCSVLPKVLQQAGAQMDEIGAACVRASSLGEVAGDRQ